MGDRDGVLKAKTECFEHMMPDAVAVLNADDDKLATVQTVNGKPAIYYGKESASDVHKSVYTTNIENLGFDGMKAHLSPRRVSLMHKSTSRVSTMYTMPWRQQLSDCSLVSQ